MKSVMKKALKFMRKDEEKSRKQFMNNRGVLGTTDAIQMFVAVLVLAVLGIAMFLALGSLQDASLFATGSKNANNTDNVINNVTAGVATFFASIGTVFSILIAVIIVLTVVLIIIAIASLRRQANVGL